MPTRETIRIDSDISLPSPKGGAGVVKYPFRQLEVGQSFFVPGKTQADLSGSIGAARRAMGRKFATRRVTEDGVTGTRVWRLE